MDGDRGEGDAQNEVGTEASELPDEVYTKIASPHSCAVMINLRVFPARDRNAAMACIATLPVGIED
ncbi:MAG: hypothetical protein ACK4OP_03230 [Gemmobacter sp.]